MDAIEFSDAEASMGALLGLRKLHAQADAAGRAATGPDAGGLSIGRRLVVMVNPRAEGQPQLEESGFRRSSPPRSSRGPADKAGVGVGTAAKSGAVQVIDHGVQQKEAVRRLFEANVLVASLEAQLDEKELLISRLSQQLSKNGFDVDTAQPEQSTQPFRPVHIEVVHEVRPAQPAKPAHLAKSSKPARLAQPEKSSGEARAQSPGPSQADKRRIAQEKVNQEEAAQCGTVRRGFPKWLMADESSRQAIEKVWNRMLGDWMAKNTFEKNDVVHNLWHCGFEFAMRWGGDPNELLQEQISALTVKYSKVQRDSQKEIAMLRQHTRKTEVQYKKLQEYCQKVQAIEAQRASLAVGDATPSRMPSRRSVSESLTETLTVPPSPGMRSARPRGSAVGFGTLGSAGAPVASPSQGAAAAPSARGSAASARSAVAPVASPSQAAAPSPSALPTPVAAAAPVLVVWPESPGRADPTVGKIREARAAGNRDIVDDDTLMVDVAAKDLEAMDHEVFESIRNLDEDQQEMVIDMVNDKVRRILALDPSKWTDGRLPFGLRPDNTPGNLIKLEAENKHLKSQLIETEEALSDLRRALEAARQGKQPSEPAGKVNQLIFKKAIRSTLSIKAAVGRHRGGGDEQATASDADANDEDETEDEDESDPVGNLLKSKDRELKALRDKVAALEERLRKHQADPSKAKSAASLAQRQLAQKEDGLKEQKGELDEQSRPRRGRAEEAAQREPPKAEQAERSTASAPALGAAGGARPATSGGGDAASFRVVIDRSSSQETAGVVVSRQGGPPPALRVEGIDPGGPVAEWNRLNPGAAVAEGDLIVEINGASGDGDALMQAFEEHGLLKMRLLRDPGLPRPSTPGGRTASQALGQAPGVQHQGLPQEHPGLPQVAERDMAPTSHQSHQRQAEASPSRGGGAAEGSPQRQGPAPPATAGAAQRAEARRLLEDRADAVLPTAGALEEEELHQLRQRCKSQEDEIARLVLIIDELRVRMQTMVNGGEPTPELALQVGGLLQKAGLKEVVDASASEAGLRPVFRRLYQDAVQRLQRFAMIRQSVKSMNKAILAGQDGGQGSVPPPDLEHLNVTAAAALSGMWYGSGYIFKRMCKYAASHGVEEITKSHTTSLVELLGSAPSAEDTDAAPQAPESAGIHGRPLCTPPRANLERLPGRRSERFPRTLGHPLPGGVTASDGLFAKLSKGRGDRARSPRQQQLRQAQLDDPEPTPFTSYIASVKEARGDLQGSDWARASLKKQAAGERPPRTDALGEGGKGVKVAHGPAGSRGSAKGGLLGARSLPVLPKIRGALPDGEADAPPRRAQELPLP